MSKLFILAVLLFCGVASAQNVTFITSSGPIAISITCNRVSGTAPLSVLCHAVGTTATGITKPFHDLEYRWDFGDSVGGAAGSCGAVVAGEGFWACGSRAGASSKNEATGPVAGHMFESAGARTITLQVTNGTNTANTTRSITVNDPGTVYSGTNTICVRQAATGDFAGCPAGASQVTDSSFQNAVHTYAIDGRRLLFRRGDTWAAGTTTTTLDEVGATGGTIGAFGTGALPLINRTGTGFTIVLSSGATPTFSNWRIMDLELAGDGTAGSGGVVFWCGANYITLLRMNIHDYADPVFTNAVPDSVCNSVVPGHGVWDSWSVVDSNLDDGGGSCMIMGLGTRFMINGNSITDSLGHNVRLQYYEYMAMSNNTITNGLLDAVTLRAVPYAAPPVPAPANPISRYAVLSDNWLADGPLSEVNGGIALTIRPVNAADDGRIEDVIVERTWFRPQANITNACIRISARNVTIRNNLCDLTGGVSALWGGFYAILSAGGAEPAPAGIVFHHNSVVTNTAGQTGFRAATFFSSVTNVGGTMPNDAKNNIAYGPSATSPLVVDDQCACADDSNNSASATTNPNFTAFPWTVPASAEPTSGYAVDSGATVPVWSDFFRNAIGTRDIGAVRH